MAEEEGTVTDSGHSTEDDLDLHEEGMEHHDDDDFDLTDKDEGDEEEPTDDDGDPDDDSSKDGYEKRYKDLQKAHSKSQDDLKAERDERESLEHNLTRFGGIDQAIKALDYVTNDKDFKELAAKKSKGETVSEIDESKMSPQGKEALNTVRQVVKEQFTPFRSEIESMLKEVIEKNINPHTNAMKDVNLEHHIDKMTDKYGEGWLTQLDSMEKLKSTLSEQARVAPTFIDIDRLYKDSLEKDGKFDAFIIEQASRLAKGKKSKTTKRHKSSGGTSTSEKDKNKPPKDIFEAARRVTARDR